MTETMSLADGAATGHRRPAHKPSLNESIPTRFTSMTTRVCAGAMATALGFVGLVAADASTAQPAAAAGDSIGRCPGGNDDRYLDQRRQNAEAIAAEAAGKPRLIIEDAQVSISESPSFDFNIGTVIEYSVYADTVVEVAKNQKLLGEGWARISVKTSTETGCAWALISDKAASGPASFWIDIAPDANQTDLWQGLISELGYNASSRSAYHGPTVQIPQDGRGAVRACAKWEADSWITTCTDWVRPA